MSQKLFRVFNFTILGHVNIIGLDLLIAMLAVPFGIVAVPLGTVTEKGYPRWLLKAHGL